MGLASAAILTELHGGLNTFAALVERDFASAGFGNVVLSQDIERWLLAGNCLVARGVVVGAGCEFAAGVNQNEMGVAEVR